MTFIANPIYDSVFKFLMEDERAAKTLLSALLKKEVRELQMRSHEHTNMQQNRISLFRLDFAATIADIDGTEHQVLIELQKTWLATETLRFRQYLGTQYLSQENIPQRNNPQGFGLPIISIYILGHKVGDLKQPVVYVRRQYLDYDDNLIEDGTPDPFIESLTHDSIIVQIPYLQGRTRNRLERLLTVFDQEYRVKEDEHLLKIDEREMGSDERIVVNRLIMAAASPNIRREMQVEDEILSEIEKRDTTIMQKDKEIELQQQVLEQQQQEISQQQQEISQQQQEISQQQQEISQQQQELDRQKGMLRSAAGNLRKRGLSIEEISAILAISKEQTQKLLDNKS